MSNSKRRTRDSRATAGSSPMEDDFRKYLNQNKLTVYADVFEKEGVFSLDDFQSLDKGDIDSLIPAVEGIGYRKRLRNAHSSLLSTTDQKDEESDPPVAESRRRPERGAAQPGAPAPSKKAQRKKPKSSPKRRAQPPPESVGFITYFLVFALMMTLLGAAILISQDLKLLSKQAGLDKPYPGRKIHTSMKKFYPFYLKQHANATNQALHAGATGAISLVMLFNPSLVISMVTGISAGLVAMPFCPGFSSGVVEGLIMLFTGQLCAYSLNKWRLFMLCLVLGYGAAWVGHFQFEMNQPATFQAPTYSLLSDYLLAFNYFRQVVLTKQFPLVEVVTAKTSLLDARYFEPMLKMLQDLVPH